MQISIVTPSYNQRDYLAQTLNSVLTQQGDFDLQHLVMDGGSTDGTVELLQSTKDPRLTWQSQKDKGQSDALNRGLHLATGDIIGWLNSDDLYTPNALAAVAAAFQNPDTSWLIGRCQIIDSQNNFIRPGVTAYKDRRLSKYSYQRLLRENFISQPSVFWRRTFGQQVGPIDESLHHAMDYDLWLRMGKQNNPVVLDQTLSHFRIHPQSKSGQLIRERFDEDYAVTLRHTSNDPLSRRLHWINNEKIVWAYRLMSLIRK